jgi:hypothetical protein
MKDGSTAGPPFVEAAKALDGATAGLEAREQTVSLATRMIRIHAVDDSSNPWWGI